MTAQTRGSKTARAKTAQANARRARRRTYPLHKRILLHPVGIFGLLCAGVCIAGWTYHVVAATTVSTVIEAPALQAGAEITSPADGAELGTSPITVSGTCPQTSYVTLSLNGSFGGVGWCDSNGTFSITTSLFSGDNTLSTQDYNITDLAGPTTSAIHVTYQPPQTPTTNTPNTSTGSTDSQGSDDSNSAPTSDTSATSTGDHTATTQSGKTAPPLLTTSDFHFKTFTAKSTFTWKFDLEGGTPPYHLHINWGDGTSSEMVFKTDPIVTLKHTFTSPGYYAIIVTSDDKNGQQKVMQLAALITNASGSANFLNPPGPTGPVGHPASAVGRILAGSKWLLLAWPTYLTLLLMAISFWLGEKRQYAHVRVRW